MNHVNSTFLDIYRLSAVGVVNNSSMSNAVTLNIKTFAIFITKVKSGNVSNAGQKRKTYGKKCGKCPKGIALHITRIQCSECYTFFIARAA